MSKFQMKKQRQKEEEIADNVASQTMSWGKRNEDTSSLSLSLNAGDEEEREREKKKPNFGLSGKLMEKEKAENERESGTTEPATTSKYTEPASARHPDRKWRLYVFKKDEHVGR